MHQVGDVRLKSSTPGEPLIASAYSSASRVLLQHGPSLLAVSGCILGPTGASLNRVGAGLFGLTAGLAFFSRPSNALILAAMAGWGLLGAPSAAAFLLHRGSGSSGWTAGQRVAGGALPFISLPS